jgi:ribose transport system substrate-binding protein
VAARKGEVTEVRTSKTRFALQVICVALALGLVACGDSSDDRAGNSGDSLKIYMVSAPPGDDFYYTIERAAKAEAERIGADLEIQNMPKYEASSQVSLVNAGIAKKPDAILVGAVDVNALQAPLERAVERGIKVITFDGNIRDPEGVAETFVSSDIVELGRSAARTQLELIGNRGKVFYQGTAPDTSFFDNLRDGWTEIMDAEPGIEQLPVVYSDFEPSKASSQMQTILTAHPDLAGGFAGIFLDQQGIVPALERAGKINQVRAVGVDGATANVERLRKGQLGAIVSVKAADYGTQIIQAAKQAVDGKQLPSKTVIGQCVLTAETLDDPANRACLYEKAAT